MKRVTDPEILKLFEQQPDTLQALPIGESFEGGETLPEPRLITDPEILNLFEEPKANIGAAEKILQEAKKLGKEAVEAAKRMPEEYSGVGGMERLGLRTLRGVAAGATKMITGMSAVAGGAISAAAPTLPMPSLGLKVAGENLAQISNDATEWIDKNLAIQNPDLFDELTSGFGSMIAFMIPGLGVARAVQAVGGAGKAATIVARVAGSSVMSAVESATEQSDMLRKLMNEGMTAEQALAESGKVFWANLPATMITNFGYFHPMGRIAAAALEGTLEGVQESYQAAVQDWAQGMPAEQVAEKFFSGGYLKEFALGAAIGAPMGAVTAGEVAESAPPPRPEPEDERLARYKEARQREKATYTKQKIERQMAQLDRRERAELDRRARELGYEDAYEAIIGQQKAPESWPKPLSEAQISRAKEKELFKTMPTGLGSIQEIYDRWQEARPTVRDKKSNAAALQKIYGLSGQKAKVVAEVVDARARQWAKDTGKKRSDWYKNFVSEMERGGGENTAIFHNLINDEFSAHGTELQMRETLKQEGWSTAEIDNEMQQVRAYFKRVWGGRAGALRPNQKTTMAMDLTTICPKAAGKEACLYCYVQASRGEAQILAEEGKRSPMAPFSEIARLPYTDQILQMPASYVRYLNRMGGMRVNAVGDYKPWMREALETAIGHAQEKGLMLKFFTKQKEAIDLLSKHENVEIQISADEVQMVPTAEGEMVPTTLEPAPTVEEAHAWKMALPKSARRRVKVRVVAINSEQAWRMGKDRRVDVVTMYHGAVGERLFRIWQKEHPKFIARVGEEAARKYAETWENMSPKTAIYKMIADKYPQKLCCQTNKCRTCPVCCGYGANATEMERGIKAQMKDWAQGGVEMTDNGVLIRALNSPTISSALQAYGSVFLWDMIQSAKDSPRIAIDLAIIEDWLKIPKRKDGTIVWKPEHFERFAANFEAYLYQGIAPNNTLRRVFAKLRQWIADVYQSILGSSPRVKVNENIRRVFDRMLGQDVIKRGDVTVGMGLGPLQDIFSKDIDEKYADLGEAVINELKKDISTQKQLEHQSRKGLRWHSRNAYRGAVDNLTWLYVHHRRALERAGKNWFDQYEFKPEKTPYFLTHLAKQSGSEAMEMWNYGIHRFGDRTKIVTRGAGEILAEVEDLMLFQKYQQQLSIIEYDKVKGKGFVDAAVLERAKEIVSAIDHKYDGWKKLAEEFGNFQNEFLRYLKDAGAIDGALADWLEQNYKFHVPLYKLAMLDEQGNIDQKRMQDIREHYGAAGDERAGTFLGRKGKIEEGTVYVPPIEAALNNMAYLINMAYINLSKKTWAQEAADLNDVQMAKPESPKMHRVKMPKESLDKIIDTTGWHEDDIAAISTFWTISQYQREGVMAYRDGGQTKFVRVDQDVWNTYRDLSREHTVWALRWAAKSTKLLRFGVTMSPDFLVRNLVRDLLSSSVIGKNILFPGASLVGKKYHDPFWAMWQILEIPGIKKKGRSYRNALASGLGQSTLTGADLTKVTKQAAALAKSGKFTFVRRAPSIMMGIASQLDNISRLPQYQIQLKKYQKLVAQGKMTELSAQLAAARDARFPSIDFQRSGTWGKKANLAYAFLNAAIQGMDIAARQFGQPGMRGKPQRWSKALMLVTMPSVVLWAINHDEDWYKRKPRWMKDMFWLISFDGGDHVIMVPKPFEIGLIFGSLPERILDQVFNDDPRAIDQWLGTFFERTIPMHGTGYVPTPLGQSVAQWWTNRDPFGHDIVPYHMQDDPAEYQYDEQTSETAKLLGKISPIKMSPAKLDQWVQTNFGTLSKSLIGLTDFALRKIGLAEERAPAKRKLAGKIPVQGTPGLQAVVRIGEERSNIYRGDFYHYRRRAEQARRGLNHLIDQESSDKKIKDFVDKEAFWLQIGRYFRDPSKKMADLSRLERDIMITSRYTPDEKRKLLDTIIRIRNDIAEQKVKEFLAIRESVTDAQLQRAKEIEFADAVKKRSRKKLGAR